MRQQGVIPLLPLRIYIVDDFSLAQLPDSALENINSLSAQERTMYFHQMIEKFYPDVDTQDPFYPKLQQSYSSSFSLEQVLRGNKSLQIGFTAIYTKTGIIRDIVNDLYFNDDTLVTH